MPQGKPAGVRCIQLDSANQCLIFGQPGWPAVCAQLQAAPDMCGADAGHALVFLARLEAQTQPQPARPAA